MVFAIIVVYVNKMSIVISYYFFVLKIIITNKYAYVFII